MHAAPTVAPESRPIPSHFLQALLKKAPDAIYFKDRESRFLVANQRLAELLGVDHPDQLIGKSDFDFFTEEHARPAYEDEQAIIKTGLPLLNKVEQETHRDNEITWASTNKFPLYNEAGEIIGTFGISRNITQQKDAEAKLAQYQKDLIASERRAAVAEFASAVFSTFTEKVAALVAQADRLNASLPAVIQSGHTESMQADLAELRQTARQLHQLLQIQST